MLDALIFGESFSTQDGVFIQTEVNSFSTFFAHGRGESLALPVKLTSFSAHTVGKHIQLNWETATEVNNAGFEIEKSTDGLHWAYLDFIKGNSTSAEGHTYNFNDKNPVTGVNYYRLRQVDFDGKFDYSKVVTATFEGDGLIVGEIYPNPTSGILNIPLYTNVLEKIEVTVFDGLGQKILENHIRDKRTYA